ncbi:MutS-related protein [Sunxiuqinia sp. A32]|uniref:MutS-related protein n=1 Tax=Sunxiuqinia sp. A32 TaxID=3461496 RepID=UPI0040459273
MKSELFLKYENYLESDRQKFAEIKKRIQLLSVLRLLAFVSFILALVFYKVLGAPFALSIIVVSVVLFFYWIKKFIEREKQKRLYGNLIEINQKELLAVSEEYSQFDGGDDFKDGEHPFSNDLDLFGEDSVFQFLNRTTTQLGRKKLAEYLSNPMTDIERLEQRQEALKELSKHTRWRQFYEAKGKTHDEDDFKLLKLLAESTEKTKWNLVKWLVFILPAVNFMLLLLLSFSIVPWSVALLSFLFNGFVLFVFRKVISSYYNRFGKQSKILQSYLELILMIEKKGFQSEELVRLKGRLLTREKKASEVFVDLKRTMARFDYRANLIFAFIGEFVFIWDLICVYQLNNWQLKYKDFFYQCFDVISQLDALCSLGNLNHNHPEWTIPSFEKDEFHYAANDLAHPLINSEKRIGNSFRMNGEGKIAIVTGANMAGKSTFLRALGVNFILALNGCRVCASWFTIKPAFLYSNMRTTDNLHKDESYFFAELLRLQNMLKRIRNGEKLFLLIDEMLKGTNSHDKLSGSRELIKQLIHLRANGVVATHDLELTRLSSTYPQNINNLCFDIKLNDESLIFDYKLIQGVTSTMNASFLMKQMGIIEE